ncbi:MAG TPA: hypothetical protein VGT03_08620 [Candidatus Acidoferrales bacterium]|nr:hypothetical protein [Candidatus Acidoferrales bacterium]
MPEIQCGTYEFNAHGALAALRGTYAHHAAFLLLSGSLIHKAQFLPPADARSQYEKASMGIDRKHFRGLAEGLRFPLHRDDLYGHNEL